MATWVGQSSVRGSSETMQMALLTFSTIGYTFTWAIEGTYCTPYLLNLGLTKSNTSLVWIAGPLSGLVVQPIVGVWSDESTSRWGRRRPLMVIGSAIVAISLLILGFTRDIVDLVIGDENMAKRVTIVLAVLAIYVLDFAINAVMSCGRSLIVDTLPIEKQQSGAAWSSRMAAVGNMVAYACGSIDLVTLLGTTMGDSQFKQLTILATLILIFSTALTCWAVEEKALVASGPAMPQSRFKVFRQIAATLFHLPPRIRAICWAQFWSWIGWFPFLFYSTTWVGETYFRYDAPPGANTSKDMLGEIGRIGSSALTMYSIVTFIGAFVLPMLVKSPEDEGFTRRPPRAIAGFLERFSKVKPDLLTTWIAGQFMFAASMAFAPFAMSFRFATVLVCLCGLPWTIALWAPVAFLGVEVNKMSGAGDGTTPYRRLSNDRGTELADMDGDGIFVSRGDENTAPSSPTGELSGIYFGILNIFTTLPQFVGTFISAIVFLILEPGKSPELSEDTPSLATPQKNGPNAIAVCLFIGAMSSIVATFVTRKLRYL
ncbi:major facilitator superfamily domain-containing protein [Stachybotrys elegans]|uniref:Major facilitator superfamily domain-containing protein n=1 Tax=Stachybotrys elegans TaxID=80388 RepID=A0A8K0T1W7_9HYPO|nr:major facilitator superfamily domain-containing protein [Stachybotrys elegans]